MPSSREALLSVVERSPACVAAHDRAGWLALFTDDAVIEDPVGSAPVPKEGGVLERFYDTFIGPHEIRFEILRDHVLGNDVFRDAVIHTRVREGVEVQVSAYLLYQIEDRGGALFVRRMAAHWTLARMTSIAMRMGPRAWLAMTGLFARMLGIMGPAWVAAYLESMWRGAGARGTAMVEDLARTIQERDVLSLRDLFTEDAVIDLGEARLSPAGLLKALPAGTRLSIEAPVVAGWTISFRFRLEGAAPREGLCLLEIDPDVALFRRARFFPA
jgi:ketosteroid isomerase-like protein